VVGAPSEASNAQGLNGGDNNLAGGAGAVYLFQRDSNLGWQQQAHLKASNSGAGDNFGHALAISGDGETLAVGALKEDSSTGGINNGAMDDDSLGGSGAVYLY